MRCNIPEGPEVKLSADLIRPLVLDRSIISLGVTKNSRYANSPPEGMKAFMEDISSRPIPTRVTEVNVKGKFMYWKFSNDWCLMNTFGMTGQWSPKEGNHPCFFFTFATEMAKEDQIYFNDPRHFGTIKFTNSIKELSEKLEELGWDPLSHGTDTKWTNFVFNACSRKNKPIGQILLDQKIFSGVGNYIRAEALYLSRISPWRQANLLKKEEILFLCESLVKVMKESYDHQGATILTYKTAYGAEGQYSSLFKVYDQDVDPLGNAIVKETTPEGRTIHWCPAVQI